MLDLDTSWAMDVQKNRSLFPAGLYQPEGAFRFSADALILAEAGDRCMQEHGYRIFADLGTGCGIVALTVLLKNDKAYGIGVDREAELVHAARINARKLGVDARFAVTEADVREVSGLENVDMVLANPPWRVEGTGRVPTSRLRRSALFGDSRTLTDFAIAARKMLRPYGRYLTIIGAEYAGQQQKALTAAGFDIECMTPCAADPSLPPRFMLFTAGSRRAG